MSAHSTRERERERVGSGVGVGGRKRERERGGGVGSSCILTSHGFRDTALLAVVSLRNFSKREKDGGGREEEIKN